MGVWRLSTFSSASIPLLAACAFFGAASARAQSTSVDAERAPPPVAPAPVAPRPTAPPPVPVLPPHAISTPISYPDGQDGAHDVVLELTISKSGAVLEARAVSGDAPFTVIAAASSKAWQFEPATRAGVAISVKIRFAVHFEPPASEPAPTAVSTASVT